MSVRRRSINSISDLEKDNINSYLDEIINSINELSYNPFGGMYSYHDNQLITFSASGVNSACSGLSSLDLRGFDFGSSTLTANVAGYYLMNYAITLTCSATDSFSLGIAIDGSQIDSSIIHSTIVASAKETALAGTTIMELEIGDVITLILNNKESTTPVYLQHVLFTITKISG